MVTKISLPQSGIEIPETTEKQISDMDEGLGRIVTNLL